jgi:hypothetical protein
MHLNLYLKDTITVEFDSGKFPPLDYDKFNVVSDDISKPKNFDFEPIFHGNPFISDNL